MSSLPAINFQGRNEAAQAAVYVRNYSWRISQQTKAAINALVQKSIREGLPPMEVARLIRASIGLNEPQTAALSNYAARLRESGLSSSSVAASSLKYADRLLTARSRTIARTEVMGALNAGSQAKWESARNDGLVTNPHKEWMVTPDELLCPICEPLAGVVVPLDDTFPGGFDQPPAHPNCRCTTAIVEVESPLAREVEPDISDPDPLSQPEGNWEFSRKSAEDEAVREALERVAASTPTVTPMSRAQLLQMAGVPSGARVSVTVFSMGTGTVRIEAEWGQRSKMTRLYSTDGTIHNQLFVLSENERGQGSKMFAEQVRNAAAAGWRKMETDATRSPTMNGHYTWARLGYMGAVRVRPDAVPAHLRDKISPTGILDIREILKTPEGRTWWKENGWDWKGHFDLSEGSQSRRLLDAYLEERGR